MYNHEFNWRNPPKIFPEQYFFPRGKRLNKYEGVVACAIREFIEETKMFVKIYEILQDVFTLYWVDDGCKWVYDIVFVRASLRSKNIVKHIDKHSSLVIPEMGRVSEKCCFSPFENQYKYYVEFTPLVKFKEIMWHQIKTYSESNYADFVNHVEKLVYSRV